MTDTLKVLGQSAPAADTDTDLYTVPAATSAVTSTLTVCNRGSAEATFRVAVRPAGAVLSNEHYLYHGAPLAAGATMAATLGLTLAATDVVTVRASTADLSFTLAGVQVT